ncbi:RDD family protein [Mucilaginibacter pocheonensis]|uniref:RDD family membrane protein YckC n=1 Tax=Mucilaginibacter pocheonensis TaxID=398050 RepID=A0ABU1TIG6_9SPHI|nr:RDD family protein [Mucilaginibacter pocheonensis]MDR6945201.1 putative RDD family membrane protein YckC [Mucilaginibacter pocheonensis]
MAPTYILVIKGKPEGPFSVEELKARNIRPGDFVKTPEMDDYKEAQEIAELREILGFKKPALLMQYFGSFDQRLLASVLDWFMLLGVFIIIAFIVVLMFIHNKEQRIVASFSFLGAIPFAKIIYHIIMESSAQQATHGKQMLKIKVVDMQGNRISTGKAISRNLCKIFSVATFFVGYLLAFFNKKQQCLHDMMAGTLVIKDRLF